MTLFYQEFFSMDYESKIRYLLIIECIDDAPVKCYIVKIPRTYTQFPMNPYLYN